MTELTFESRKENALILLDEDGNQFTLPVDEALLSEVRLVVQQMRGVNKVRPAKIQNMLRAGHSVSEVAALTDYDIEDVERFADPVIAELNYILQRAFSVTVRTSDKNNTGAEKFGEVIDSRLVMAGAANTNWRCYKDAEKGWQIALEYTTYGKDQQAVWSFDSQKLVLTPETAEAVELSKQQLNDSLIPKPRPVAEPADKSDSRANAETANNTASATPATNLAQFPDFGADSLPVQESFDWPSPGWENQTSDLGETANLLEALRSRRNEREKERAAENTAHINDILTPPVWQQQATQNTKENTQQANISDFDLDDWDDAASNETAGYERLSEATEHASTSQLPTPQKDQAQQSTDSAEANENTQPASAEKTKKKGRKAMPSWDEILFGTRSEEDPA